jgi:hypothetical protein
LSTPKDPEISAVDERQSGNSCRVRRDGGKLSHNVSLVAPRRMPRRTAATFLRRSYQNRLGDAATRGGGSFTRVLVSACLVALTGRNGRGIVSSLDYPTQIRPERRANVASGTVGAAARYVHVIECKYDDVQVRSRVQGTWSWTKLGCAAQGTFTVAGSTPRSSISAMSRRFWWMAAPAA